MVLNFHCNKWITGGDPTKQIKSHDAHILPDVGEKCDDAAEWNYLAKLQQSEAVVRCNESAGHGQMMDVETSYSDFINCDRTGRRNAVPDISPEGTVVATTSELTKDMAEMDLKAAEGDAGASPAPAAEGSTSQDAQGGGGPS